VFAAGSLAIKYGILPWQRDDLLQAILTCQLDGVRLALREPANVSVPGGSLRQKLVTFLRERQHQFVDLDLARPKKKNHKLGQAPGYRTGFKGELWFYLTADQLGAIVGTDGAAKQLKDQLISEGLMATSKRGFVVQRPIFDGGKGNKHWAWVCAFKAAIIA
jgi:hypothetical protein